MPGECQSERGRGDRAKRYFRGATGRHQAYADPNRSTINAKLALNASIVALLTDNDNSEPTIMADNTVMITSAAGFNTPAARLALSA
jgi:hypothetical protein